MGVVAIYGESAALAALEGLARTQGHVVSRVARAEALAAVPPGAILVAHVVGQIPAALAQLPAAVAARFVLFLEGVSEEQVLALDPLDPLATVISMRELGPAEMYEAIDKALDPHPLGIARLAPGASAVHTVQMTSSMQRGGALAQLEEFAVTAGLDPRRAAQLLTIADELLTNAFYHAPVDGMGGHPYTSVSRMDVVQCHPSHPVELSFCSNARRIVIGVRDHYGSLDSVQARHHLAKAATDANAKFKVTGGVGGARLGLITALRASSQLSFNLVPGRTLECIGVVEIGGNYREFLEAGRTLSRYLFPPSVLPDA